MLKPVIIIAIAIGCSVAIFFAFSIYDVDEIVKTKVTPFDCAKAYDEFHVLIEDFNPNSNTQQKKSVELIISLLDNRCHIIVKSWAHESFYENDIWAANWETQSYLNQVYLGEVPCNDKVCQDFLDGIRIMKETLSG